jgi:hypothetical protein
MEEHNPECQLVIVLEDFPDEEESEDDY